MIKDKIAKKIHSIIYFDGFISSFTLKIIACILMLIDHFGIVVVQGVFLEYYNQTADIEKYNYFVYLYGLLRKIGRLSFPIFAFLIVVGFINTRNRYKYLLRMFIFSILTENIFDYVFFNKWFYFSYQNVLFTYTFVIITLIIMEKINSFHLDKVYSGILKIVTVLITSYLCEILKCDYGAYGVFISIIIYLTYNSKPVRLLSMFVVSAYHNIFSSFAIIPIYLYNGRRGIKLKYFFYFFYPLHLVGLYILGNICKNFL